MIDLVPEPVDATAIPPARARGRARVLINVVPHLPPPLATPVLSPRHRTRKALLAWGTPLGLGRCVWDGLVSTPRGYTEADLRELVAPFGAGWIGEAGTFPYPPFGRGTWFRGLPRR